MLNPAPAVSGVRSIDGMQGFVLIACILSGENTPVRQSRGRLNQ